MEEGVRILSRVTDCPPDALEVGMPSRGVRRGDGRGDAADVSPRDPKGVMPVKPAPKMPPTMQ
jgi:hypothetical protein